VRTSIPLTPLSLVRSAVMNDEQHIGPQGFSLM